jgi:hypothetical protein
MPRPRAKNENRQLSCSSSPGSVSPSARNASLALPSSTPAAISTQAPLTRPTVAAVPEQAATARRQVGTSVPLYRPWLGRAMR